MTIPEIPPIPEYLAGDSVDAIHGRMLAEIDPGLDKSPGSIVWDMTRPAALALREAGMDTSEALRRSFVGTSAANGTFGLYLDHRANEHGLTRIAATYATGTLRFTGTVGATVPAGTLATTQGSPLTTAVRAATDVAALIPAGGLVDVAATALVAGPAGNVQAGAFVALAVPVLNVSGVTNLAPFTGGNPEETDDALRVRYLIRVRNPSAGGNRADYVNWSLEASTEVGGVAVVPVRDGPGTVSVAIIDRDRQPANQALVDDVQDYIAPPHQLTAIQAETAPIVRAGFGTSVDTTQPDDINDSVLMVYNASGAGTLRYADFSHNLPLPQPGVWQLRTRVRVNSVAAATNLLTVGVWNVSESAWAVTEEDGVVNSTATYRANQLTVAYAETITQFYWNNIDILEVQVDRLVTDTTTQVWVDQITFRSTFSTDTGAGKAPVGARVRVEPAGVVLVHVSATLTITVGYDVASVRAQVTERITIYLQGIAFSEVNDVQYARIGTEILNTQGVTDYTALLVNSGTANVAVGPQQVAVAGTMTWN